MVQTISTDAIERRKYWVLEIQKLSGDFGVDLQRLDTELSEEMNTFGTQCLIDHLRLCGNIPESYDHDSSEEKLYSKYTDSLLSFAYRALGLRSILIKERADAADVEAFANDYSFVADAKAFRLSRTAKNQKDFKVQAMDGWRKNKPFAMVVCPIYQLPRRQSQIYEQASRRNVCILTYSHISLLVNFAIHEGQEKSVELLFEIFSTVQAMNPSKSAQDYWQIINKTILRFSDIIIPLWKEEKQAAKEATEIAKKEGLTFLESEREKIMRMTYEEAVYELLRKSKIDTKIETIESINDNGLFAIQ